MTAEAHGARSGAAHHPNYIAIFWWLLALTIVEIAIGIMHVEPGPTKTAKVLSLILLAGAKAALVAMYFMHLRFERTTLALIAGTPIVLCLLLMLMLLPDAFRGLRTRAVVTPSGAAPQQQQQ